MLHFASSSSHRPTDRRQSSFLNATQTKFQGEPMFLAIEEQLHDARRVQAHGQEDDLRAALGMVIERVVELSTQLQEALKAKTELETQLSVAKSNLQLVIANNEMLEEAVGNARDVGWRRGNSDRRSDSRPRLSEDSYPTSPATSTTSPNVQAKEDSRFFKFRFNNSTSSISSRPSTPASPVVNSHKSSPSLSSISTHNNANGNEGEKVHNTDHEKILQEKEDRLVQLLAELEKERELHQTAKEARASLEAEIESLSAALFEEANKMVATERIKLHEIQEELNETRHEREALKSALRLIEGENKHLRSSSGPATNGAPSAPASPPPQHPGEFSSHSRSSSNVGVISPRSSPSPVSGGPGDAATSPVTTTTTQRSKTPIIEMTSSEIEISASTQSPPVDRISGHSSRPHSTEIAYQDMATPIAMKTALPSLLEESPWR